MSRTPIKIGALALTAAVALIPAAGGAAPWVPSTQIANAAAAPLPSDLSLADLGGLGQQVGVLGVGTAANGTSTFALTRWDGANRRVQSLRVNAALWRTDAVDLSAAGQDAQQAAVAVSPAGVSTLAWVRSNGTSVVVQAVRIDPKGRVGRVLDLSAGPFYPNGLRLASAANGTTTLTWQRSNGERQVIQAVRIDAEGRTGRVLALSAPGANANYPDVAMGPDGSSTVVWTRFDAAKIVVQAVRIDAKGRTGRVVELSSHSPGQPEYPRVATAPNGVSTVVWLAPDGAKGVIRAVRIDAKGRNGRVMTLSAPGQDADRARLSTSRAGITTIAWTRSNGSDEIVQAVRIDEKGRKGRVLDLSAPGQNAGGVALETAVNGTTTVVWQRPNGTNEMIQVVRIDPRGRKGRVLTLSPAGSDARSPKLSVAPNGTATIAWNRADDPAPASSVQAVRLR